MQLIGLDYRYHSHNVQGRAPFDAHSATKRLPGMHCFLRIWQESLAITCTAPGCRVGYSWLSAAEVGCPSSMDQHAHSHASCGMLQEVQTQDWTSPFWPRPNLQHSSKSCLLGQVQTHASLCAHRTQKEGSAVEEGEQVHDHDQHLPAAMGQSLTILLQGVLHMLC